MVGLMTWVGWLSLTLFLISYKRRGEREGDEIKKPPNCPSHQVLHVPLLPVAKLSLTLFPISYKRRGEREGDEIKKTSNCRTSASGQTPCHHATQQYTNRCFADLNNSQPGSSVSCVDLRSAVWISGQLCGSQVSCVNHRDTDQQGPDFSGPLFATYRHCPWLTFPNPIPNFLQEERGKRRG